MATYFHGGSEIQANSDAGLHTLYLMNPPSYVPLSDTQHQHTAPNMLLLNNPTSLSHAPPQPQQGQHFFGVPFPANHEGSDRQSPPFQYNLWAPVDQNSAVIAAREAADIGFRRPPVVSPTQQGLSLSLSGHAQGPAVPPIRSDEMRVFRNSMGPPVSVVSSSGMNSCLQSSSVLGSKYMRAAQELLDEVVNVGKGMKQITADSLDRKKEKMMKIDRESTPAIAEAGSSREESSSKQSAELSTAQRQELQMKKDKLIGMLEEVEQRYRQYHQQMQVVVSMFEQAAGLGSAKSYTAMALQTISRQFRCLKDTISEQITATNKSLGEDDYLGAKVEGSRLRLVDHQIRQQRALQQLGMIPHNAWRPQRGLPERAVTVLRGWLFDHFLHPYPKDSDKIMLAKQTGLTRSQVSNWFINARVRLWKPMVEEMYNEETKEQEQKACQSNLTITEPNNKLGSTKTPSKDNRGTTLDQIDLIQSKSEKLADTNGPLTDMSNSSISSSTFLGSLQPQSGFSLVGSSSMDIRGSPKKPRNSHEMQNSPNSILSAEMDLKQNETNKLGITERLARDRYSFITDASNQVNGYGAFPIGEIGRFSPEQLAPRFHGNAVSLTLALPHCDDHSPTGASQPNYVVPNHNNILLGRRIELGTGDAEFCAINPSPQDPHSNTGYEIIGMQNRKRLAAQLLPDFVA